MVVFQMGQQSRRAVAAGVGGQPRLEARRRVGGRSLQAEPHRRKFRLEWDVIADALADVRTALGPVRPVDVEIHPNAVSLARSHGFNFYDALIVASALAAGCDTLLTEDHQAGQRAPA